MARVVVFLSLVLEGGSLSVVGRGRGRSVGSCACSASASGGASVRQRTVDVDGRGLRVTILELARPQELVESWASTPGSGLDPFGLVLWPGAQFAARLLCDHREDVEGASVLVLGAGTGLEALTAAALGARRVTAVDIHSLPLALLADAAQLAGVADVVHTRTLDLTSDEPLPAAHDIHLCALPTGTRARASARGR